MSRWRITSFGITAAASLIMAVSPAAAASDRFSCQGTPLNASYASAQPGYTSSSAGATPCYDRQAAGSDASAPGLTARSFAAFTHIQRPGESSGAAALASATDVTITGAGHQIVIGTAQAQTTYACQPTGAVIAGAASAVSSVTVDGKPLPLSRPDQPTRVALDKQGSYLQLNQQDLAASSQTRTAAFVHLAGFGDFVVAQAELSQRSSPCSGAGREFPAMDPCPGGSSYDPTSESCQITEFTPKPIYVKVPFGLPSGGSVLPLGYARATMKKAHCLAGPGPAYVIIASPGAGGLIIGTPSADRILALAGNYRIRGGGGRDCIFATGGSDIVKDGNGKISVFTGTGGDQIRLGNGRDFVSLGTGANELTVGNGNDRITTRAGAERIVAGNGNDQLSLGPGVQRVQIGNGNDAIYGAPGVDLITAGNGNDTIVLRPGVGIVSVGRGADIIDGGIGYDRITARGPRARVRCAWIHDKVTLNPAAVPFAVSHGCTRVATVG